MNVFVINCGSSSIKYQLFKMPQKQTICSGLVERIGLGASIITHKIFVAGRENTIKIPLDLQDHQQGLMEVTRLLTDRENGVIQNPDEIAVAGHRVVHGGRDFKATTVITAAVKAKIKQLFSLAPLHNPANLMGIEVAEKIFEKAIQVAVFDTAFYQTLPEKAFRYAIPDEFYTEHLIRVYGFHGTSHKYVSEQAKIYDESLNKIITIHLGNGCSITAIDNGRAVDTSMGFGPVSGLVMGTRAGDIDASVIFYLVEKLGYSAKQVDDLLNKKSGMLGLTGLSDMRDIQQAVEHGNEHALLAVQLYCYRIKKYIGAYAAVLNGLDAIVFTAGVGENAAFIRQMVCADMQFTGIRLDEDKNRTGAGLRAIHAADSAVKILVIPTNEELEIAKQCYQLLL